MCPDPADFPRGVGECAMREHSATEQTGKYRLHPGEAQTDSRDCKVRKHRHREGWGEIRGPVDRVPGLLQSRPTPEITQAEWARFGQAASNLLRSKTQNWQ